MTLPLSVTAKFEWLSRHRPVADSRWLKWFRTYRPVAWFDRLCTNESGINIMLSVLMIGSVLHFGLFVIGNLVLLPTSITLGLAFASIGVLVGLMIRAWLRAWYWGPVSMEQLEQIKGWMSQSSGVSEAVSAWIRPGLSFYLGDYRVIRHAIAYELRYAHQKGLDVPTGQLPFWVDQVLIWWKNRLAANTARSKLPSSPPPPDVAWSDTLRENSGWALAIQRNPHAGTAWPAGLTPIEQARLNDLEALWNQRRAQRHEPISDQEKEVWTKWVHAAPRSERRRPEGMSWQHASLAKAGRMFMKYWLVLGVVFFFCGSMADIQREALYAPVWEKPEGWLQKLMVTILGWAIWLKDQVYWLAPAVAFPIALWSLMDSLPLHILAPRWWSLPLGPEGREELNRMLFENPALKEPFLARLGPGMVQADLAFVRQAAGVLERYQREEAHQQELERAAAAIEGLPAMATYRARLLENALHKGEPNRPNARL